MTDHLKWARKIPRDAESPLVGFEKGQQDLERPQLNRRAVCQQQPLTQQYPEAAEFERRSGGRTVRAIGGLEPE